MKTTRRLLSMMIAAVIMLSLCACNAATPPHTSDPDIFQAPEGSTFHINFFDVGQADAALIECDDNYMLIDGGNKSDSQKMYAILKEKGISHLEYVIATNINAEHIGGLAGALNYATASTTFCPVVTGESDTFNDFKKYADKNGGGITVPIAGNKYKLGIAEIEFVTVNGNTDEDCSLIVKITYGNTVFLFAGNTNITTEQIAMDSDIQLKSTLLKMAAHGSDNTSSAAFIREVQPEYAVISTNGSNGCPGTTTLGMLEVTGIKLYRTDLNGDILCTSDGNTVTFTTEKQADADKLFVPGKEKQSAPATTQTTDSPFEVDELYKANLMTTLVQVYGSVKRTSYYMDQTHIMGSYMVGEKFAYLNSHIFPDNKYSCNGWYAGYEFYNYGMRPAIIVDPERLNGSDTPPNQTDLSYFFTNKNSVEYLGRDGENHKYLSHKEGTDYTVTVDSQSLAILKVESGEGENYEIMEYVYGERIEGQDILDGWQNDTGLKVVNIYVDLYDGDLHKSYSMPTCLPENWELEIFSSKYDCTAYMDENYTQLYQYPGDGVSYSLYITNAVG